MSPYILLKFIHVFCAIIAVGVNISYVLWIRRAEQSPAHLPYVLNMIRYLDRRLANPSYVLILLSGLGMTALVNSFLTTFWVVAALALYVVTALIGVFVFAPNFRRQIAALETEGFDSPEYRRLARRTHYLLALTVAIVVTIVALMVFRPNW